MDVNQNNTMDSQSWLNVSPLVPWILAALVIIGFAGIEVFALLVYSWSNSGTLYAVVIGAFVLLGTIGYPQWCNANREAL